MTRKKMLSHCDWDRRGRVASHDVVLLVIPNAIQGAHGSRVPSQIANSRVSPPLIGVVEAPDVRFTTAPESTLR